MPEAPSNMEIVLEALKNGDIGLSEAPLPYPH
jgi:hypothetical protein